MITNIVSIVARLLSSFGFAALVLYLKQTGRVDYAGKITTILTLAIFLSMIARHGSDIFLTRLTRISIINNNIKILKYEFLKSVFISLFILIITFFSYFVIEDLFIENEIIKEKFIFFALLVALVLSGLFGAVIKGSRKSLFFPFFEVGFLLTLTLLAVLFFDIFNIDINMKLIPIIIIAFSFVLLVVSLFNIDFLLIGSYSKYGEMINKKSFTNIDSNRFMFFLIVIMTYGLSQMAPVYLHWMGSDANTIAEYFIMLKVMMSVNLIINYLNAIYSGDYVEKQIKGNYELSKFVRSTNRKLYLLAFPALFFAIGFNFFLIEEENVKMAMYVIALAQSINIYTGNCVVVSNMCGGEKCNFYSTLAAFLIGTLLLVACGDKNLVLGLSLGVSAVLVIKNLMISFSLYRYKGISIL